MLAPVLVTPPTDLAVSLDDAKRHLRVDNTDHDDEIGEMIVAATEHLDGYTGVLGKAICTQTWRQDLTRFGPRNYLPVDPVAEVESITYFDTDNVEQTLTVGFRLLRDSKGSFVALRPGYVWPDTYDREDAVSITYTAGVAAADVRKDTKAMIKLIVGDLYAFRETAQVGSVSSEIPFNTTVDALLAKQRAYSF
ncbi:MAG: phage head-tail connector protein [Caulobacter sp.]|nr:phage head-tail connector protein [Caulobacter sp.]